MLFQKNQKKISSILRNIYKPSLDERDINHLKDQIIQIIKKFNQDNSIEYDDEYRSPGWDRYKKNKLLKWKK